MTDFIIAIILLLVIGGAMAYIIKEKKNGPKCIGCPDGCSCSAKNGESSDCGCHSKMS